MSSLIPLAYLRSFLNIALNRKKRNLTLDCDREMCDKWTYLFCNAESENVMKEMFISWFTVRICVV